MDNLGGIFLPSIGQALWHPLHFLLPCQGLNKKAKKKDRDRHNLMKCEGQKQWEIFEIIWILKLRKGEGVEKWFLCLFVSFLAHLWFLFLFENVFFNLVLKKLECGWWWWAAFEKAHAYNQSSFFFLFFLI